MEMSVSQYFKPVPKLKAVCSSYYCTTCTTSASVLLDHCTTVPLCHEFHQYHSTIRTFRIPVSASSMLPRLFMYVKSVWVMRLRSGSLAIAAPSFPCSVAAAVSSQGPQKVTPKDGPVGEERAKGWFV